MANRIESFSLPARNKEAHDIVDWTRRHSINHGPSFSHIVIKALLAYKKEILKNG